MLDNLCKACRGCLRGEMINGILYKEKPLYVK